MTISAIHYWLASLYLQGIGPRTLLTCVDTFGSIEKLFLAKAQELKALGLTKEQIAAVHSPDWQRVEQDLRWAEMKGHDLMTYQDADYPRLLKEIPNPPLVLFILGHRQGLNQMQLAMVGSRRATPIGLETAYQFAYHLAGAGLGITSGLALGIDGASHRGALAANGLTIGVAGTGLNHLYPAAHYQLVVEIVEKGGAVISEFPLNTAPNPKNFPHRNRIISGLSSGVLVIEAALRSGSLITAKHALEQNREVFAVPGSIHHPLARGCHSLIRQGAKLVERAEDVLEELGSFQRLLKTEDAGLAMTALTGMTAMSPRFRKIFDQIGHEMTTIDMIILRSGLTMMEVSSILLKLELSGYVHAVQGGYVRTMKVSNYV